MLRKILIFSTFVWFACGGENVPPPPRHPDPTMPKPVLAPLPARRLPREDAGLLPRKIFFENPDRARPRLSPNGKSLAYLSAVNHVLNVWVSPAREPSKAKPVTDEKKRPIRHYEWAYTSEHLVYLQDKDGDENTHLYVVDLATGTTKDLTPIEGVKAELVQWSDKFPGDVIVGLNDRDKKFHDLYRVNLKTGERKLIAKNEQGFAGYSVDRDFRVRLASKIAADGGEEYLEPIGKEWRLFTKVPFEDSGNTQLARTFDRSGEHFFSADSRGRDTAALVRTHLKTQETSVLFEAPQADVGDWTQHPKDLRVDAVSVSRERQEWRVLSRALDEDFAYLTRQTEGDLSILSRSLDDKLWLVSYDISDGPTRYFLYDRGKKSADFLFANRSGIERLHREKKLSPMHPVTIKSRDGLDLVSYLTLPAGTSGRRPEKPVPMVLFVHGGPWARDSYGFHPYHQWFASRGYAALSVNYRGSVGFGKSFVNAANQKWAAEMHYDLLDAVSWAIAEKIADKDKVAIMGGSYGGYATLVGLTFTPKAFACGVDIVGPSNLVTLLQAVPPYWVPLLDQFTRRVGDHRTEEGRRFLESRSPLFRAGAIERPLLIGQGANDPRVKKAESDQIVAAMKEKGIPVTYVLYPDEGHGFARPENRTSFNAVAEIFLAECLGGPYEPIGKDFEGASIQIPFGAKDVHSVEAFLGQ